MEKKYELQKLVENDQSRNLKIWRRVFQSNDIQTLRLFMTQTHRIVDAETKDIVMEYDRKND